MGKYYGSTSVGSYTLIDNSKEALNFSEKAKEKALTAIGMKAVGDWQKEIRDKGLVDTTRFVNSPEYDVDMSRDSVTVGTRINDPEYPVFLELGTSRMSPKPTLKPSIEKNMGSYKGKIEEAYKNA